MIFQILNRRNSWRSPLDTPIPESIRKWPSSFAQQRNFHFSFRGMHHEGKLLTQSKLRNHFKLRSANRVRRVRRDSTLDQFGFAFAEFGDLSFQLFKVLKGQSRIRAK